jgi:hypothetical protein
MTLRTRLLVIGAIRGAEGRQPVLRLGLRGRWRQRFAALLARIAALAVSTVAQFAADQKYPVPRPWKPPPRASNHPYFQRSNEVFGFNRGVGMKWRDFPVLDFSGARNWRLGGAKRWLP